MTTSDPQGDRPRLWRIAPAGELLRAEFDGHTVVYHTGAGHTHWISAVAAEVLGLLDHGPSTEADLYLALSGQVDQADIPLLADALRETMEELRSLTLVEPA